MSREPPRMSGTRGRFAPPLWAALALYLSLTFTCVQAVGVVGEVAIGWALPSPPRVLTQLSPPIHSDIGEAILRAAQTRPTERLVLGGASLPLAINAYTGGVADWPARLARAATGSSHAGVVIHVALGALLVCLTHRFLTFHGTHIAAAAAAFILASDWCFVFYRKVLGGTEILLQAAALLVLWALWSRRWRGGVHGAVGLAIGVGLGLLAKVTFVATLGAFVGAIVLTRWDHPRLKPPRRVHPALLLGIPLLCVAPLLLAAVHHAQMTAALVEAAGMAGRGAEAPLVRSHDTLGLQFDRLWSGWSQARPAREGMVNLLSFFGNPLRFFADAYGAVPVSPFSPLKALGYGVTLLGAALEWRPLVPSRGEASPQPSSGVGGARTGSAALLRFLSIFVPLQVGLLWLLNRDLHHLAQATVPLAMLAGLAADRVASTLAPPRSIRRAVATGILVAPLLLAGVQHLRDTDAVVATVRVPSFTETGQASLVSALREAGVTRLLTSDYEVYGMLEVRAPEIDITHTWGALSRGNRDRAALLSLATDGWYLSIRASAPMIYNWSPDDKAVAGAAARAGVAATPVATLTDATGTWATIWRVASR